MAAPAIHSPREMTTKKRTWLWIVLACLAVCVIAMFVLAGAGMYFVMNHVNVRHASSADALRSFDDARKEFKDQKPLFVIDSREREADDRLRRYFDRIHREGTRYTELSRIVDSLLLGPSHYSLGLQMADLVVGTTHAAQRAPGEASRWLKQLSTRFARHPASGEIDGVGLKFFPDKPRGEHLPTKLFDV